jgi:hypothetical protein
MGLHNAKLCNCGSGKDSYWENDAQGIPVFRACSECLETKWSNYRPCIRYGYDQSDVDEPIEPEDY